MQRTLAMNTAVVAIAAVLVLALTGCASNRNRRSAAATYLSVSAGGGHTVAIRADGSLWAWGENMVGQLGIGETGGATVSQATPVRVGTGRWAFAAASHHMHTVAIAADGSLWAWGWNELGQLGDGTTINRASPVRVGTDANWASASAGTAHTVAIRTDGTLWAWGLNERGQLGIGELASAVPYRATPTQIGSETNWASVAAGANYTLAIRTDGTLWAWGLNEVGQLGNGTTTDHAAPARVGTDANWALVSAGSVHTVAIRTNGTLWAWGWNGHGQLGAGEIAGAMPYHTTPIQIGADTNWASASARGWHTVAIRTNGALWAWGWNEHGQLGDGRREPGSFRNAPFPIGIGASWASAAAGFAHTMAIRADGTLWGWGDNASGQLGDGTATPRPSPAHIDAEAN